jgi:hypothetical protein
MAHKSTTGSTEAVNTIQGFAAWFYLAPAAIPCSCLCLELYPVDSWP